MRLYLSLQRLPDGLRMITCEMCQRTGTRGFHRVYRWKPEGQWVCDNVRARHKQRRPDASFTICRYSIHGNPPPPQPAMAAPATAPPQQAD